MQPVINWTLAPDPSTLYHEKPGSYYTPGRIWDGDPATIDLTDRQFWGGMWAIVGKKEIGYVTMIGGRSVTGFSMFEPKKYRGGYGRAFQTLDEAKAYVEGQFLKFLNECELT